MKIIRYRDSKNSIEARVHMIVYRPPRSGERQGDLLAVGLIDADSSARAMIARILKGEKVTLYPNPSSWNPIVDLRSDKYMYRFVARPIGKLTHAIAIHKSAVDDQLPNNKARIIFSPTGTDVADLFLLRFASDYKLPYVQEWKDALWRECTEQELVQSLEVWTDPEVDQWKNLRAIEISPELTEERAKEILSALLRSGEIQIPEGITEAPPISEALVPDEQTGEYRVTDYLETYAPHLAAAIEQVASPAHDLDQPIDPAIATMKRVPFPAQAHTAQAILNGYKENKGIFLAADMGCGKSIISLAVANALASKSKNGFACLLLVPGITVPKWIRDEIGKTLPWAKVTHLEDWHDVVRYWNAKVRTGKKDPIEFVLLSRDTAKFGMPKAPALIYKETMVIADRTGKDTPKKPTIKTGPNGTLYSLGEPDSVTGVHKMHDVWLCPDCGAVQVKDNKTAQKEAAKHKYEVEQLRELKLGFSDLANGVIEHDDGNGKTRVQYVWKNSVTECHCTSCGHNLMRYMVPDKEKVSGLKKRRMQPAWLIQKLFRGYIDLLICDELHQYKANSGQGIAMGMIAGASKRVLGLTGTLSDGSASSLYHLLWRIAPQQMKDDRMDHRSLSKFVHLYGTMEQKGRYDKDEISKAGGSTSRTIIMNPPREVPGLSPRLFVNHLSDKAVFLELGDMGLPLVELKEEPVFVQMERDHQLEYTQFHNHLEGTMRQQYAIGNTGAFAKFIPSVVNASNQPHISQELCFGDDSVTFTAPNGVDQYSAKEHRILNDVLEQLEQNRRCVVYVRYSGEAHQDRRLLDIFRQEGIRAELLPASVAPEDRVDWLEKAVERGVDVVVTNAKLVEVGLDLLSFPTLLFYQFTDEVSVMRQAAKRSWRIGQHRKCIIRYYTYQNSYEMVQFKRMLTKRSHSLLLEGRIDKSDVAMFVEEDSNSASTFAIANCLGNVEDLTQKWQFFADKDIPAGVTMLAEDNFKEELGRAMQRLAAETKRLAGVSDDVELPSHSENTTFAFLTQAAPKVVKHDAVVLPLFETVVTIHEPVQEVSDYSPVTVGDLRIRMGMVVKATRAKSKISDNQIALFAFDAV